MPKTTRIVALLVLSLCSLLSCRGDGDDNDSPVLRSCGGLQGLSCKEGDYCDFEDFSCGAADQTGVCKPVPEVCTELFAPVCGCDGTTYGNACFAAGGGISLQSQDACPEQQP